MLNADQIFLDVKSGLRQLRKRTAISGGSALAIAFAIGVSLTVFCAFCAVFLQPPPYPGSECLVSVEQFDGDHHPVDIRFNDVAAIREQSQSFSGLASLGYSGEQPLSGRRVADSLRVQSISADLFSIVDVKPILGHVFAPSDAPGSALISSGTWQRLFSIDKVIGRTLFLHRESCRIVGILPEGFDIPNPGVDIWIKKDRPQPITGLIGRLKPHITPDDATRELRQLIPSFPDSRYNEAEGIHFEVRPLAGRDRPLYIPLFVLLILAAVCILVLAFVNVESSLIARAHAREFEFALRKTLGAARSRLFFQVLVESMVLSISGGLFGVILGCVGIKAIKHLIPESVGLTRLQMTHFDLTAWYFAGLTTVIMGLLLGVTPAMLLSKIGAKKVAGGESTIQ